MTNPALKVFVVSTCIPERGADPCQPAVFATEAEAELYVDRMMRAEWDAAEPTGDQDEPCAYPEDWRTAQDTLVAHFDDGSWGTWQITEHTL